MRETLKVSNTKSNKVIYSDGFGENQGYSKNFENI